MSCDECRSFASGVQVYGTTRVRVASHAVTDPTHPHSALALPAAPPLLPTAAAPVTPFVAQRSGGTARALTDDALSSAFPFHSAWLFIKTVDVCASLDLFFFFFFFAAILMSPSLFVFPFVSGADSVSMFLFGARCVGEHLERLPPVPTHRLPLLFSWLLPAAGDDGVQYQSKSDQELCVFGKCRQTRSRGHRASAGRHARDTHPQNVRHHLLLVSSDAFRFSFVRQ